MKWCWFLSLTLAAWEDVRSRQISFMLILVFLLPGIWNVYFGDTGTHLLASLTGAGLLALSRATRGAIGAGDGWFFLLSACYLNVQEINLLFLGSLGIGCIWGMILMLKQQWSRTIPFLACAWPVGLWIVCW